MTGGVVGGSAFQSGSFVMTNANVCEIVSPAKSDVPVSISQRTTPNAHTSARLSTGCPVACSGAMYAAVPRISPACVARIDKVGELVIAAFDVGSGSNALANPKSNTLTTPSLVTLTFAGF